MKMCLWLALIGVLYGIHSVSGYGSRICYHPPSDLCKSDIPEIHSLETRDPSYFVNNETIHWRYCDVYAIDTNKWYKSESKMTTSCPSVYTCGTKFPIWMKGKNPDPEDGLVIRKSCVSGYMRCCHDTYRLAAFNCGNFLAYCFIDLPYGCHQRYCFDNRMTTTPELQQTSKPTYVFKTLSSSSAIPRLNSISNMTSQVTNRYSKITYNTSQASSATDPTSDKSTNNRNTQRIATEHSTGASHLAKPDVTTSNSDTSICYRSNSDICEIEMSDIPSLETRSPLYRINKETGNRSFCDVYAINTNTWYKSEFKMSKRCPRMYRCGTKFPIWMNGKNPKPKHGVVNRTSCVRSFDNCCQNTYKLTAVNCQKFMAYCFVDLPHDCQQGYCFVNKRKSTKKRLKASSRKVQNRHTSSSIVMAQQAVNVQDAEKEKETLPSATASVTNHNKLLIIAIAGIVFVTVIILGLLVTLFRRKRKSKIKTVEDWRSRGESKRLTVDSTHVDDDESHEYDTIPSEEPVLEKDASEQLNDSNMNLIPNGRTITDT